MLLRREGIVSLTRSIGTGLCLPKTSAINAVAPGYIDTPLIAWICGGRPVIWKVLFNNGAIGYRFDGYNNRRRLRK